MHEFLCTCCLHCLSLLFSLMRICMIRSHSSFHRRAWMGLPFLPTTPASDLMPPWGPPIHLLCCSSPEFGITADTHTDVCVCLLSVSLLACQLRRGLVPHRALSPGLRAGPTHGSTQCKPWRFHSFFGLFSPRPPTDRLGA